MFCCSEPPQGRTFSIGYSTSAHSHGTAPSRRTAEVWKQAIAYGVECGCARGTVIGHGRKRKVAKGFPIFGGNRPTADGGGAEMLAAERPFPACGKLMTIDV